MQLTELAALLNLSTVEDERQVQSLERFFRLAGVGELCPSAAKTDCRVLSRLC